ncbi:unnamed protein product [Mytilus coruscus]|uniref:Endonuclease/exonuclease/phosphatase domain-containing protein n=1 Tax=Mytilus coruscus TaxID=42192 RepID=A0A6J8DHP3_MYTCO|nr:unnamed protein product [Mytilus coruscus]
MLHAGRRPLSLPIKGKTKHHLVLLLILLGGNIEQNPGPREKQQSIYPCGLCDHPVTWKCEGVCCDDCDVLHHRSCIELCTADYELLERSNVQWLCCKCDSINMINVSSFTFHNYELNTTKCYEPLSHNITSIKDKTSEFKAAVNYIKPDIICGTESWLKGEKPGKNPTKDAIKSGEVFPEGYTAYRNDRETLGGGVFILVHNDIITVEHTELVTNCEIEWVKIQLKGKKELLIDSFYMPQRNMKCVEELEKSHNMTIARNTNIMLTGDFNCPDINWETSTVNSNANDKEIQNKIMELTATFQLTQIYELPTRENNLLDLVFTTNLSLVKTSKNTPGISDHEMVTTDCDTKPYYQRSKPRKCYIYSKANWEKLNEDISKTSTRIKQMYTQGSNVQEMSDTFKKE